MEISLSIVGTAFRKEEQSKCSKQLFNAMYIVADGLIDELKTINYEITHIVSGGAAGADHVAVQLFLNKRVPHLRLFIPTEFEGGSFYDNGDGDPYKNSGGTLNHYHRKFQIATHINSLTQIQIAKSEGAELIPVEKGFHARNALVSKSDFILAMTFGNGHEVKDGGTAHTVKCYLDRVRKEGIFDKSFHYDLNSGKIFEGCTVPKEEEVTDRPIYLKKRIPNFNSGKMPSGFHTYTP